jgi:hypothetical protein
MSNSILFAFFIRAESVVAGERGKSDDYQRHQQKQKQMKNSTPVEIAVE